jgi:hypothetical protein
LGSDDAEVPGSGDGVAVDDVETSCSGTSIAAVDEIIDIVDVSSAYEEDV